MPVPSPRKRSRGALAEFQRAIAGVLMKPLAAGEKMQRHARAVAERLVKPNDRLSAFDRLQIYNQQYWWRLLGSLQEDFRGLRAVLGARTFERLCVAYLEACGSRSWNLRDLGQHLETFAAGHPTLLGRQPELALEMIRVEWARVVAFDGEARVPLDPARLQRNTERLRIGLQPYVTLLELRYPIDRLLARLRQRSAESVSNAVTARTSQKRALRLTSQAAPAPVYLAVHRADLSVYYKRLDAPAFRILQAIRDGASLGDACGTAFGDEVPPDAAARVQAWFATWMQLGWLTR